ncbi:MAG TPA: cytochrome C oxidase subunit IV family protein [Actinomycetota bacterium]|nr:cytochrome C oxidase subunit IV family protein [Actinomycetota bacterium]
MSESQTSMEHVTDPHMHEHPSPRKYVNVAIILAIVTAIEVAIYYVTALADLLVPILLALAIIKFVMVGLYFMHLKFDSRTFRRFFATGIFLALIIFGFVLWMFFTRGGPAPVVTG